MCIITSNENCASETKRIDKTMKVDVDECSSQNKQKCKSYFDYIYLCILTLIFAKNLTDGATFLSPFHKRLVNLCIMLLHLICFSKNRPRHYKPLFKSITT